MCDPIAAPIIKDAVSEITSYRTNCIKALPEILIGAISLLRRVPNQGCWKPLRPFGGEITNMIMRRFGLHALTSSVTTYPQQALSLAKELLKILKL